MAEEQVDIVDAQNNILYSASKSRAHKEGLLHRTVIAEIKDSRGRRALVRQAPDRQDGGQYVSPVGGHARSGETEEEALKREVFEEVGLVDFDYRLVGRLIYNRKVLGRLENHYFIVFEIFSDESLTLNHEAVEYRMFTDAELRRELSTRPELFGAAFHKVMDTFYPQLR